MIIDVERGAVVESSHRVHAAVRFARDGRDATFGDPGASSFWRSALKPFQALMVVEDGVLQAFGLDDEDLAVICASHGGTPDHVGRVERILDAIGQVPDDLRCGPHVPYHPESADALRRSGLQPGRQHNNCSGKHASMLALALHRGWDHAGYWRYEHPVQARVRALLLDWIDSDPEQLQWATDGCGVPTPTLPLAEMAMAYARLAERSTVAGSPTAAVVAAMTSHPELTSSPGREPLRVMQATGGRLLAKEGAEGVLCIAGIDAGWGMALKVEDGARRAVGPAAVEALVRLGLVDAREREALRELADVPILSTRGATVGRIHPRRSDGSAAGG